jgi:hypothetical protein
MGPREAPPFDDGDNDMEMGPQSTASPSEPGPLPALEIEDGLPDFDSANTDTTEEESEMAKKKAAKKSKTKKPAGKASKPSAKKASAKPAKAAKVTPAPKATDPAGTHNYPAKRAKAGEGKTRFIGVLIHTSEETLKRIDRKVAELQKKSPDSRISRSSFVRGLIDKATAA